MSDITVSFHTLGCRLNQSETAVLQNLLEQEGFAVVGDKDNAQIAVINTCTVTANGDADTLKLVRRISRANPRVKIALIGCQSQVQGARLARLQNVRWVVGTAGKMDLPRILKAGEDGEAARVVIPPIERRNFFVPATGVDREHTRVNLKIQDGCDFFCSYCEVPYARGRARSRVYSDIMSEAGRLAEAGHKEIVLTGINLGAYRDGPYRLLDVIDGMAAVEGLRRLRISSIELTTFTDDIFLRMIPRGLLCRFLHVPLQSADNRVLGRMKRRYTSEDFAAAVRGAHRSVPDLCVGTDVIVGFPGETEASFDKTYTFLESCPVQYFHVFRYSRRNLAKSKDFPDPVPTDTIRARGAHLRALSQKKRKAFHESLSGKTVEVLFEEVKSGVWAGWSDQYVRVKVKSARNLANQLLPVRLGKPAAQFMVGEIL